MFTSQAIGIVSGLVAIVLLVAVYWVVSGKGGRNPLNLIIGADGRPSTSKAQFLAWTVVVLFSYVALEAARLYAGLYDGGLPTIPRNVLIALGLTTTSLVAAKAITTSQVSHDQVDKSAGEASGFSAILQDDAGYPELSKVQLLAWTAIAIVVFLTEVVHQLSLNPAAIGMPDIDSTLMVLMGLGQAAYLGKKLVTTSTPRITAIAPSQGAAGTLVALSGISFGSQQGGSVITIDGAALTDPPVGWSDTQIQFKIPDTHPATNAAWTPKQRIKIGVEVDGISSANTVPFLVTPPASAAPATTPGAALATTPPVLTGSNGPTNPEPVRTN